MDASWTLLCAATAMLTLPGLTLLEAGGSRTKNSRFIFLKNILSLASVTTGFWAFGFAIGFGDSGNEFSGMDGFFLSGKSGRTPLFALRWIMAAMAAFASLGSVADRFQLTASVVVGAFVGSFLQPCVAHWVWSENGFLSTKNGDLLGFGLLDFAGSAVIHVVGGTVGLIGAKMVGARLGRFDYGLSSPIPAHNVPLSALGVLLVVVGWFGVSAGCTLGVSEGRWKIAGRCVVNTAIGIAASVLAAAVVCRVRFRRCDLRVILSGVLAGIASTAAGCAFIDGWASFIVGFFGDLFCNLGSYVIAKAKIDDPFEAASIHGVCGIWGCIGVGLFARREFLDEVLQGTNSYWGLLLGGGYQWLTYQVAGVGLIIVFSLLCSYVLLFALSRRCGLRVDPHDEVKWLDELNSMNGLADSRP